MTSRVFQLRLPSLVRGNVLVALSLLITLLLAGSNELRVTPLLVLPLLIALWGAAETARCMRRSWSWYHGGVLLLLYSDLMVAALITFYLIYPYLLPEPRH